MCSVRFTLTTPSRHAVEHQLKTAQQATGQLTPGRVSPRHPRCRGRPEVLGGRGGLTRA